MGRAKDEEKRSSVSELRDVYYTEMGGFGNFEKVWRKAKKLGFTQKEVKDFLARQRNVQETKEFKKKPLMFTSVRAKRPGTNLQIDLMFFKPKDGIYTGALNVIDVYSRRAWSELIKGDPKPKNWPKNKEWKGVGTKGKLSVLNAFKKIIGALEKDDKKVRHVNMDQGGEFTNPAFRAYLDEKGIEAHVSRNEEYAKNPVVERFNRTLRNIMAKYKKGFGVESLVDKWPVLLRVYNTTYHRTIKADPMEVWTGEEPNRQKYNDPKFDFSVGDQVRLLTKKNMFDKGAQTYSKEVFTIDKIDNKKHFMCRRQLYLRTGRAGRV